MSVIANGYPELSEIWPPTPTPNGRPSVTDCDPGSSCSSIWKPSDAPLARYQLHSATWSLPGL
jgi:hypothetical protein